MSKKTDVWMPLYIGDYLADTGHLSTTQHGAYLLLMMHYWRKGGLPDDDKQLAAIAKLPLRIWLDTKETLQSFFHDGWQHNRINAELEKRARVSKDRASAGKKGGESRGKKEASASVLLEQNSSMLQSQSQRKKEPGADAPDAEASRELDPRKKLFDEGLDRIAKLTGRGPNACRSFVGKCLKEADDDAIVVLGLIEEAERNRVVDPTAWIAACLKGRKRNGSTQQVSAACDQLIKQLDAGFGGPAPQEHPGGRAYETDARLLSYGRG